MKIPNMRSDLLVVGVVSFLAGATLSHFITKKVQKDRYDQIVANELKDVKEYFTRIEKPASPVELAKKYEDEKETEATDYHKLAGEYKGDPDEMEQAQARLEEVTGRNVEVEGVVPMSPEVMNIFTQDPNFDYEAELAARTPEKPYIIHYDEFMPNEENLEQASLTYYEGDDVLVDGQDDPVEDVDGVVGEDNLQKFGHGSKDNNIVYIRNEHLGMEFEIVKNKGKYTEQVLGFIEHSARRKTPKFRSDDE